MTLSISAKNHPMNIQIWNKNEDETISESSLELTCAEKRIYDMITNINRKSIFLIVRKMARKAGIMELIYDPNGKPICNGKYVSISHSGEWIGLMVSEKGKTGLDIEHVNERIHKIKERFLSSSEINEICKNDLMLLTLAWCAKEAIFKKYGEKTVFFKANQHITEIDESKCRITVASQTDSENHVDHLAFERLDNNYFLVYTM